MSEAASQHADHQHAGASMASDHGDPDDHCARHAKNEMPSSDVDCCASAGCMMTFLNAIYSSASVMPIVDSSLSLSRRLHSVALPPITPPPRA
ncbi:MAG: hypothetical protein ACRBM6_26670 [Geminicoccales bacterium]